MISTAVDSFYTDSDTAENRLESGPPRRLTPEQKADLIAAVHQWWNAGCHVHPAVADGSKKAFSVRGGSNQRDGDGGYKYGFARIRDGELPRLSIEQIERLIQSGRVDGIGIFCGTPSNGLEMVEVEARARGLIGKVKQAAIDKGCLHLLERLGQCVEESASGGLHFPLRVVGGPARGDQVLARRPDQTSPLTLAETSGQGQWFVAAPSAGRTHKSGKPYRFLRGSPATIPEFTPEERDQVYECFRAIDEMPKVEAGKIAAAPRPQRRLSEPLTAGEGFNRNGWSWEQILTKCGKPWRANGQPSKQKTDDGKVFEYREWTRPGKQSGTSASTTGGILRCWTSSSSLPKYEPPAAVGESGTNALTKFEVYAHLYHKPSGDPDDQPNWEAAEAALAAMGFGRSDIEPPADRGPERSIDEMRQEIAAGFRAALRQPGAIHLFRPPTGTGKTTLALEAALESREARAEFDYLTEATDGGSNGEPLPPWTFSMSLPTHSNVREVEKAAEARGLQPAAYPQRNEWNCAEYGRASRAEAMGLNVFAAVCQSCPVVDACRDRGYLAASAAANASGFRIGTHSKAVVAAKMTENAQAVFIDEDPLKALAPTYGASLTKIAAVQNWARAVRDDLHIDKKGKIIEADIEQRQFADALIDAADRILMAGKGAKIVDIPLTYEEKTACRDKKRAACLSREAELAAAKERLDQANDKAKKIKKRLEEVRQEQKATPAGWHKEILGQLREDADKAAGEAKAARSKLRAAISALKRTRERKPTSFLDAPPAVRIDDLPDRDSLVIPIEMAKDHAAPDNWHAAVFRLAERFGVGNDIDPQARKIVMLAAAGELESIHVVMQKRGEGATERTEGRVRAKAKTKIPQNIPIIALDATADTDAIRAITGREVIDHTPAGHIPFVHAAIQFTADLTADTSPDEAANILEAILAKHPDRKRVGVIGWRKAIQGMMDGGHLGEAARQRIAKTAYFWEGPDRGSNDWIKPVEEGGAGCDLLIVLGTPRPGSEPCRDLLIDMGQFEAACLPDGDWGPRLWRGFRPDGTPMTVEGAGYRHPQWHKAFCLIVRAMLLQAIGRARASLPEEGIPVVVVSNEPTGLPAADPLPILTTEVRHTVDVARSAKLALDTNKGSFALRGWVPTPAIAEALRTQKRPGSQKGIGQRAAQIRIGQAVEAGLLVRGPIRGWIGISGECEPWPADLRPSRKPSEAVSASGPTSDTFDVTAPPAVPAVTISAAQPEPAAAPVIAAFEPVAEASTAVCTITAPPAEFEPADDLDDQPAAVDVGVDVVSLVAREEPAVAAALERIPATIRVIAPAADPFRRGWRGQQKQKPPPGACGRCGSLDAVDVSIHGGRSTRRECADCGFLIAFVRWYEPIPERLTPILPPRPPDDDDEPLIPLGIGVPA